LILDDFVLQPLDPLDTADIYELIVERHRAASTVVTSNREPIEWIGQMADALLAQSAIDRLQSAAYELILDGESYRRRQKPGLDVGGITPRTRHRRPRPWPPGSKPDIITPPTQETHARWSHHTGGTTVPSRWRATAGAYSWISV
jgi:hypothetical protein